MARLAIPSQEDRIGCAGCWLILPKAQMVRHFIEYAEAADAKKLLTKKRSTVWYFCKVCERKFGGND